MEASFDIGHVRCWEGQGSAKQHLTSGARGNGYTGFFGVVSEASCQLGPSYVLGGVMGLHGMRPIKAVMGSAFGGNWVLLLSMGVSPAVSGFFRVSFSFFVFASDSALDEPLMISRLVTCTLTFFICLCFPIQAKVRRKGFRLLCCYGCFHKVGRVHVLLSSIGFTSRIIQGSAASGCRRRLYHRHLLANH
jgi:hypothetical protein